MGHRWYYHYPDSNLYKYYLLVRCIRRGFQISSRNRMGLITICAHLFTKHFLEQGVKLSRQYSKVKTCVLYCTIAFP